MRFIVVAFRKRAINARITARTNIGASIAVDIGILRVVVHRLKFGFVIGLADAAFVDFAIAIVIDAIANFGRRNTRRRTRVFAIPRIVGGICMRAVCAPLVDHEVEMGARRAPRRAHDADFLATSDLSPD